MTKKEIRQLSKNELAYNDRNIRTEESDYQKEFKEININPVFSELSNITQVAVDLNDIFVDTKRSVSRCLDEVSIFYSNANAEAKRIINDADIKAKSIISQAEVESEKIKQQATDAIPETVNLDKVVVSTSAISQSHARQFPTKEQIIAEQKRLKRVRRLKRTLKSSLGAMLVIAAVTVLLVSFCFPVLQIYGTSMMPMLNDGEIVIAVKNSEFTAGDIVAFYSNNEVLIKRIICGPGDCINIDETGTVYVNKTEVNEPYVYEKSLGDCDITFPYQVPENAYFVMGDHRSVSIDSRNKSIGCVQAEQIIGRVVLRVWPITVFSWIS